MALAGYEEEPFTHAGITRPVYWRGEGPGVVVVHEIPGITPPVKAFADRVVREGYTVAMPSLFGTPGRADSPGYTVQTVLSGCIRREFAVWSRNAASPITEWLRALSRRLHERAGGPGVGAVGMCFTGNFALAMMVEPAMRAPVLSQPSLPFGLTRSHRAALHLSQADLTTVRRRLVDEGGRALALRFSHDWMCPRARFDTLQRELGDQLEVVELDSGPGNAFGISRTAHSVLTRDFLDQEGHPTRHALDRVLALFAERLRT
ncbi:MAG: dienelactone hydrolase family protein [Myxococcales bacterium]|nr:dienelactone hydrolase family protein [Myxococcales bacterium]